MAKTYPVSMEEVRHNIQKEKRIIDTLEPVMNQHRLVIDEKIIHKDFEAELPNQLFYQMTRMTRTKGAINHDDRLDALSIGVNYWVETMDRDVELAIKDHQDELLDIQLEKFMETAIGATKKQTKWM